MTNLAKCLEADGEDMFCVLGNLYRLDAQGDTLNYLRPCTCAGCAKTARFRQRVRRIAAVILKNEGRTPCR